MTPYNTQGQSIIFMQKFQELLTEAAQLKQAQLKNQRKNYESLPDYLKAGLNYSRKYQLLRRQDYLIQMTVSERLKREGNELFKIDHYAQALPKYEEALGIFRYIQAKSYDNMKDQDLTYENYSLPTNHQQYAQEYISHLVALYLNICSCLTKMNKKEDAIHSADEALKLRETAKGYYKKAQAYLQFINKETQDIKLGFYYLNKSYELSKDPSLVQQMHRIKKEIDQDREKEKQWFKFMFDKNSEANKEQPALTQKETKPVPVQQQPKKEAPTLKQQQIKNLQRERGDQLERQDIRLQKTKEKLSKFADPNLQDWLQQYEGQFIARHGSKIYSIIQLYGYKEYLGEYKALLAQCLQMRKDVSDKRQEMFKRFFTWLKEHPIDKIAKYTERYELQTKWIAQQREAREKGVAVVKEEVPKEVATKEEIKEESVKEKNAKEEAVNVEIVLRQQPKMRAQDQKRYVVRDSMDDRRVQEEVDDVPPQIQAALQGHHFTSQTKKQAQEEQWLGEQQTGQKQGKDNGVKLYSFLIALLIMLTLKLFL